MNKKNICVIGASNLDLYASTKSDIIEHVSLCGKISFMPGGVGRNISANLAALKIYNYFVSLFSNDIHGKFLLNSLDKNFVCTNNSILNADSCPLYCDIFTAKNHFGINDMDVLSYLTPQFFHLQKKELEKMDFIIFDLNISSESISYLLNNIETKWICDATSVLKCDKLKNHLAKLYILKANYAEAIQIAGLESTCQIETLIDKLLFQGIKELYITLGDEGAIFANNNKKIYMKHRLPIYQCSPVGAGDVFLAAIIYGNLLKYNIYETLSYAIRLSYSFIKESIHQLNSNAIQNADQIPSEDIITFVWCDIEKKWLEYSKKD